MRKTMMTMVVMLGILAMATAPAFAFTSLDYVGPLQFNFSGFSSSNLHADGQPVTSADGVEDSWGIGFVESIYPVGNTSSVWQDGDNGEELVYFLRGIDDWSVTSNQILSVGGILEIYSQADSTMQYSTANRTGADSYTSITDTGTLFARFLLVPGVNGDGITTMAESVFNTAPFFGTGTSWAKIDTTNPGTFGMTFDSNYLGSEVDMALAFTAKGVSSNGFNISIDDPAIVHSVPEPTTMLLFGAGLMGLAGAGMKKKQA